jgi:hypothetical protein
MAPDDPERGPPDESEPTDATSEAAVSTDHHQVVVHDSVGDPLPPVGHDAPV